MSEITSSKPVELNISQRVKDTKYSSRMQVMTSKQMA